MISAKMITYGRVEWLEESLHSFLIQESNIDRELIIVNDYPLQELVFDHPKVKIYNLKETFKTIGEKENFAMSKCSGEIIAQWDDDDIAMSNHIENINGFFVDGTNLLHWKRGVFFNHPNITDVTHLGNSGIVFSRNAWVSVGGYPIENAGYDMTFTTRLTKLGNVVHAEPDEPSWFYRWGGGDYHMSGMGTDTPDREDVVNRNAKHVEWRRSQGLVPTGIIELQPKWRLPYDKLLKTYMKK